MTRHDTPVEPLPGLVPVATNFNLWPPSELKPISLTLFFLARYSDIFSGIIELSRCHTNVPVNTDEQLRKLLQLLKDSQQGSREQEKLKNQLCKLIPLLPGSRKYREPDPKIDFDGALNEAYGGLFKTLPTFFREIDLDNIADDVLRTRVVKRFNKIIKLKILDQYRKLERQPFTFSLDAPTKTKTGEKFDSEGMADDTTEVGIEQLIEREQAKNQQRIGRQLWQYIEDDPEGKLRNSYPSDKPDANSQLLARRLLKDPPDKLSVIARELNIKYQTLNSHWKRASLPLLKEIVLEFGYQPEE
ncbi:MAG: hypothetical protein EAZ78_23015 [Oscillatoriales cyanobacterium]|uniref:hypothetical protein n=1 Tax=Microcoleus anatoxicus TaxID=2705319 RepID=UPI00297640CB|nr:MAG: hypothetical protein EAZ78_23015 [Oscillatoriales cyanobacterium]TAF69532.1 MAG: hypothetical protein EAZ59_08390 [Oscillatoriales cyanobacterium]